jgi:uncharacterized protein
MSSVDQLRTARTISVSATGSVSAEPDQAALLTGVVAEGDTARAALTANTAIMARLIEGLKEVGIAARDIQTTSFNVSPRYQPSNDGQTSRINGYEVSNQVRILVRTMADLGAVLDTAVTLGANQVGGIEFQVSDADRLKDAARQAAMVNALRRAKLLAASANAEVGCVLTIAEEMTAPVGRPMMARAMAFSPEQVPVERGSQLLEVRVSVTWALT